MTEIKEKVIQILLDELSLSAPHEALTVALWEVPAWDDTNEAMIQLLFDEMEGDRAAATLKAHGKTWKLKRIKTDDVGLVTLTLLGRPTPYKKRTREGYLAWWKENNLHMLEEAPEPATEAVVFESLG